MEKREKPGWAAAHNREKRPTTINLQKPGWKAHSWVKRPTTEEKPGRKDQSWAKRPTTENKEKPKWAEHTWVERPTTEEKQSWKEHSWAKRHDRGVEDKPTTWTARQNNCKNEISAKFSAMDAKIDEMTTNFQTSLNMFYRKVEGLLGKMTISNVTLSKPVNHDGNQMRKGAN